jgi:hypothetical protein
MRAPSALRLVFVPPGPPPPPTAQCSAQPRLGNAGNSGMLTSGIPPISGKSGKSGKPWGSEGKVKVPAAAVGGAPPVVAVADEAAPEYDPRLEPPPLPHLHTARASDVALATAGLISCKGTMRLLSCFYFEFNAKKVDRTWASDTAVASALPPLAVTAASARAAARAKLSETAVAADAALVPHASAAARDHASAKARAVAEASAEPEADVEQPGVPRTDTVAAARARATATATASAEDCAAVVQGQELHWEKA